MNFNQNYQLEIKKTKASERSKDVVKYFGKLENDQLKKIKDVNLSEGSILLFLCLLIIFFGFYPEPLLETIRVSVDNLINNYNLEITRNIALK